MSTTPMTHTPKNNADKTSAFSYNGDISLGKIQLINDPKQIDQERSAFILAESFITEYSKYLAPTDIGANLTSWRAGENSVANYYAAYFKSEIHDFIRGELHYWVTATIAGKLVGWATFQREQSIQHAVYMNSLVVHPDYQGKAIGTHLVYSLIYLSALAKVDSINLLLRKNNQGGRAFYTKLGFCPDPNYQRTDKYVDSELLEAFSWKNSATV